MNATIQKSIANITSTDLHEQEYALRVLINSTLNGR